MKSALLFASALVAAAGSVSPAAAVDNLIFMLRPSSNACQPNATGRVTVSTRGGTQYLHVEVSKLPANTGFDFFIIQVPKAPFGMTWYQGDVTTDSKGVGVADFVGVFSKETFVVAPGSAPAPVIFPTDASSNPATAPLQMYHVGLWFDSPAAAVSAGCPNTVTPFNGTHHAGVQVLNTAQFPDGHGPLLNVQ